MLLELHICNIALIDEVRISFGEGFNVLTGETGAGKSIVVDSVNLALGGRVERELMRTGAERASVTALFDIGKNEPAMALAREMGLGDEDGLLTLRRELSASGRNLCRMNGVVTPVSQLRRMTPFLVDVHGQHEHQALTNPANHQSFLDAYGDGEHLSLLREVAERYAEYRQICRQAEQMAMDDAERARRVDMLTFQIGEIESVKPKIGEDKQLSDKLKLMDNAERIAEGVGGAYKYVYAGEGRALSAQEALRRAMDSLNGIAALDESFARLAERLNDLFYAAQDVGYELQELREKLSFDPAAAERLGDRLSELKKLQRKYGPELADVLRYMQEAKEQLAAIEERDDRLAALQKRRAAIEAQLSETCARLSESRRRLADVFCQNVLAQLKDLGMGRARFEVRLRRREAYTARGYDEVEFLISANPGEPVKPLAAVASGGELSRIMLALKAIAADAGGVDAMVFDEIDTGISGRMAQVVGEKMAAIARTRQVICVTHLAQIAALADEQFVAVKTITGEHTGSAVERLDEEGRVAELARMVGGAGEAESGLRHAAHMLAAARALKLESRAKT